MQNNPIDSGNAFSNYYYNFGLIAQTSIICQWSNLYSPGSGYKYQGFRSVNAPSDTTFGWVKLNFVGDYNCNDTVYALELAYSTVPNVHLLAGQTTLTSVGQLIIENAFLAFPNPATNFLHIENKSSDDFTINFADITGQLLLTNKLKKQSKDQLDLSPFRAGLYFLTVVEGISNIHTKYKKNKTAHNIRLKEILKRRALFPACRSAGLRDGRQGLSNVSTCSTIV